MMESILPILPVLLLLCAALAVLAASKHRRLQRAFVASAQVGLAVIVALLVERAAAGQTLVHRLGGWRPPQGVVFVADPVAVFLLVVVTWVGAVALARSFLEEESADRSRILVLLFLLQAGVCGALLSGDLFDFYVFFELMGISSYAAVAYRRGGAHLEAAWKYAVLSLCGSSFLLIGVGAVYAQTGLLTFAFLDQASQTVESRPLYLFSIALILLSLCLKAAIIPLHFWLPDAHSIAPTAVSVLLSGTVVNVGAYGVLRILSSQAAWVWGEVGGVLLAAGSLTAVGCAAMAAAQKDLKRLLAYSTSSQMGYVITTAALGTRSGIAAALVTLAAHAWTKSTLFLCAGAAIDATGERRWDRMGGLAGSPGFSAILLIGSFSLAGLPPLAGFASKLTVFSSLLESGQPASLLALLAASFVMLWTMGRVWLALVSGTRRAPHGLSPHGVSVAAVMGLWVLASGLGMATLIASADRAATVLLEGDGYARAVHSGGAVP